MCGRFTSIRQIQALADLFNGRIVNEEYYPSYNVAPTEKVPIVAEDSKNDRRLIGLASFGMKMMANGKTFPLLNIRSEKVANREDFKNRRCIIPADGFYEWLKVGPKEKQPYYFSPKNDKPFAFAGLWKKNESGTSFVILTTEANELVEPIHNRMPVILGENAVGEWLAPDASIESLIQLLEPYPAELMQVWKVSKEVNGVKNKHAAIINSL